MLPSASDLRYFIEISHTLNLSRAAERLGIAQPTLTLSVKRLEEAFGLPLLIRSKCGVTLTRAGQKLVTQARFLNHEWEKIRLEAARDENEIRGHYVIGCHPSVAMYSMPYFLTELLEKSPQLDLKLIHDLSRRITEEIISFKIDFGIVVNPWPHPDLVIRPLATDEVGLWVAQDPSELQNPNSPLATLICDPHLIQSQEILRKLAVARLSFPRIVTTTSLEVIATLVAAKSGVGVLPSRVAKQIPALRLRLMRKDGPSYHDKICLIFRADAQRSRASRRLAQFIETRISAPPAAKLSRSECAGHRTQSRIRPPLEGRLPARARRQKASAKLDRYR